MPSLNLNSLELNRGVLNTTKLFLLLVVFQLTTLLVAFSYNKTLMIFYVLGLAIPLYLLFIPFEPILGYLAMFSATGLDFLAEIGRTEGAVVYVQFTYFHVAFGITFIAVLMNMVMKRSLAFPSLSLWPPLLMFLLINFISLIYTPEFPTAVWTCVRFLALAILTWMTIKVVDREWKVSFLLWIFILVPFAISVLSIYQITTSGSFYSEMVYRAASALGLVVFRATGTFQNPNKLASFIMIGSVVSFGLLFDKNFGKYLRIILLVCFFVIVGGIIATFSRGGWLATLSGLLMILLLHKKWSYFAVIFAVIFLMVFYLVIQHPDIILAVLYRFGTIFDPSSDDSSSSRLSLIRSGIWMWQDHPIFGVGLEGYAPMMKYYFDPSMPTPTLHVVEPHTVQIEMLAELGLVGFTIFVWFFFTILFHGIHKLRTMQKPFLKNGLIIAISYYVALFVNYTFSTDMLDNNLWITIGLIYAIPLIEQYSSSGSADTDDSGFVALLEPSS